MPTKTIAARGERPAGAPPKVEAELSGTVEVSSAVGKPSGPEINRLWTILVAGLVAVVIIALGGVIYAVGSGKSPDVLVTVFTSALTGLIGLFVRSPG